MKITEIVYGGGVTVRDATPEEEAQLLQQQQEAPVTAQQRMDDIQVTADMAYINSELALVMLEMEV